MMKKKADRVVRAFCFVAVSAGIFHQANADDRSPGLIGIQDGSDDFEEAQHLIRLDKKLPEEAQDDDHDNADDDRRRDTFNFNGVAFDKRAGQMDITIDGAHFATYVWNDPQTTRPYFKQVHAHGGEIQITRHHPPRPADFSDHASYQPGIWWGFVVGLFVVAVSLVAWIARRGPAHSQPIAQV